MSQMAMMRGNEPASAAIRPGLTKIPEPIVLPITTAMAIHRPKSRFKVVVAIGAGEGRGGRSIFLCPDSMVQSVVLTKVKEPRDLRYDAGSIV